MKHGAATIAACPASAYCCLGKHGDESPDRRVRSLGEAGGYRRACRLAGRCDLVIVVIASCSEDTSEGGVRGRGYARSRERVELSFEGVLVLLLARSR